jgi:hypothetical protein
MPMVMQESPVVAGSAIATTVNICEVLRGQATFLHLSEVEEVLLRLLHNTVCVVESLQIVSDVYTQELVAYLSLSPSPLRSRRCGKGCALSAVS